MKKNPPLSKAMITSPSSVSVCSAEEDFAEIVSLVEQARQRAYHAVNHELVGLYWKVGQYISGKLDAAEWGEGEVAPVVRTKN